MQQKVALARPPKVDAPPRAVNCETNRLRRLLEEATSRAHRFTVPVGMTARAVSDPASPLTASLSVPSPPQAKAAALRVARRSLPARWRRRVRPSPATRLPILSRRANRALHGAALGSGACARLGSRSRPLLSSGSRAGPAYQASMLIGPHSASRPMAVRVVRSGRSFAIIASSA